MYDEKIITVISEAGAWLKLGYLYETMSFLILFQSELQKLHLHRGLLTSTEVVTIFFLKQTMYSFIIAPLAVPNSRLTSSDFRKIFTIL